jgi:glycogen operon protein
MAWFRSDGAEMSEHDWTDVPMSALGVFLNGQAIAQPDRYGRRVSDDTFLVLFNAHHEHVPWKLPSRRWGSSWVTEIDTAAPDGRVRSIGAGRTVDRQPHSIVVLRKRRPHPSSGTLAGERNR